MRRTGAVLATTLALAAGPGAGQVPAPLPSMTAEFREPDLKAVTQIDVSNDGRRVAALAGDEVVLWDLEKRVSLARFRGEEDANRSTLLRFSPDGEFLAVAWYGGDVDLLEARSGTRVARMTGMGKGRHWPVFSPDSRRFALASCREGPVAVWNLKGLARPGWLTRQIRRWRAPPDIPPDLGPVAGLKREAICRLRFSDDGEKLFGITRGGGLHAWRVGVGGNGTALAESGIEAVDGRGHRAVTAQGVMNLNTKELLTQPPVQFAGRLLSAGFTADGGTAFIASSNGFAILDGDTGREYEAFASCRIDGRDTAAPFVNGADWFIRVCAGRPELGVWNLRRGEPVLEMPLEKATDKTDRWAIEKVVAQASAAAGLLVTGGSDGIVRVWKPALK